MGAEFRDDPFGVFQFCEQIKELSKEGEIELSEVLTALTLALRDLTVHHHGPIRARDLTVEALEEAFDEVEPGTHLNLLRH